MRAIVVCVVLALAQVAAAGQTTERVDAAIWIKPRREIEVEETRTLQMAGRSPRMITFMVAMPYPAIPIFVSAAINGTFAALDADPSDYPPGVQVVRDRRQTRLSCLIAADAGPVLTFSTSYLVRNAVRQDETGDELRWQLRPLFADGRIGTATLKFVFAVPLAEPPRTRAGSGDVRVEVNDSGLVVGARGLAARQPLQVRLRFGANEITGAPLPWRRLRDSRKRRAMVVLPFAAVGIAGTTIWIVRRRRA